MFELTILTCLEAFLILRVKTEIKVYTKLTVVMCCQICDIRYVAPSSGDICRCLQVPVQARAVGGGVAAW